MKAINRIFLSNDLITITLLLAFVLVFFMKVYKPKDLLGYAIAFFTQGFIEKQSEKNISFFSPFYILLFIFKVIILATTFFLLFCPLYFESTTFSMLFLITCFFVYFTLKQSLFFFITSVFDFKENLNYLIYSKNGYLYTSCLILFPVLIINQYFIKNYQVLVFSIAILLIVRAFLIIKNNKILIFKHMFYFILYFCALELAPLLILYKTIN